MDEARKNSKKKIILIVAGVAVVIVLAVIYFALLLPDLVKDFGKYDGLSFDYTLEEEKYFDKFYYKQLSEGEARHYRAMYHASINDEAKYYLKNMNLFVVEEAERAVEAFSLDFPEYYWFGQVLSADTIAIKDKLNLISYPYIQVTAECYSFKEEDIVTNREKIEAKLDEILPSLKGENDIDTITNIYDYLVLNTTYDGNLYNISDIRAILFYDMGTEESYAETFQLLANRLGFECYSVLGDAYYAYDGTASTIDESVNKDEPLVGEFNLIKLNDSWYWIDTAWGDSDNEYEDLSNKMHPLVDYAYLFVTDEVFFIDHKPSDHFTYPECNNGDIYLADGIIMDSFDEDVIEDCFVKAFKDKKTEFTFHLKTTEDVDKLLDYYDKKKIYYVYQNNIHRYYEGRCRWVVSNNFTVYFEWKFRNL